MKTFSAVILILACLFAWVDVIIFDKDSLSVVFGAVFTISIGGLVFLFTGKFKREKLL
jgi:K+ transporter